jgi:hypothetical protein
MDSYFKKIIMDRIIRIVLSFPAFQHESPFQKKAWKPNRLRRNHFRLSNQHKGQWYQGVGSVIIIGVVRKHVSGLQDPEHHFE